MKDAAIVLRTIAGRDPMDATSADVPVPDYVAELEKPVRGMRIGVAKEYFGEGLDDEVRNAVEAGIQKLASLGCEFFEFSLPHTQVCDSHLLHRGDRGSLVELGAVRWRTLWISLEDWPDAFRDVPPCRDEGFGAEVKRRIMLGTYALSAGYYDAYYLKAQKVRTLMTRDFEEAFKKVDAIVTPTSPTAAFKLGEKVDDPLAMYLADIYTVTADLAGIPGISCLAGERARIYPSGCKFSGSILMRPRFCAWRTRSKRPGAGLGLRVLHVFDFRVPRKRVGVDERRPNTEDRTGQHENYET